MQPVIVWIRNDLRLEDNPALARAAETGCPVVALYIWSETTLYPLGSRSRAWLGRALASFKEQLKEIGIELVVRQGEALKVLEQVLDETKAKTVFWNRRYEPDLAKLDSDIQSNLSKVSVKTFHGNILFEPGVVLNRQNKPFQVFTPFYKHLLLLEPEKPVTMPRCTRYTGALRSDTLDLPDEPRLWNYWRPTEQAAHDCLKQFIKERLDSYEQMRDYPALIGTSKLSPYLHFGQISVRWLWYQVQRHGGEGYLREIAWREFAMHLLHHYPDMPKKPLDARFLRFPWKYDEALLKAWQEGKTGYPIVDAGMRELEQTGWMHNRVRMIVASFLVKHLLLSWKEGEAWFWDKLVDADLANNSMGWQWVAGCGADAAPYFRIFNPILQGQKFDPDGIYVKRFVPELEDVDPKYIHTPWLAPRKSFTYVAPIVDHTTARDLALKAFAAIK